MKKIERNQKDLKLSKAFTLIELLVVIAIIGILSSVVLASLENARARARDARRMSDIRQIQNALELYYQTNNRYPFDLNTTHNVAGHPLWRAMVNSTDPLTATNWSWLTSALEPYIDLPRDPRESPGTGTIISHGPQIYSYYYVTLGSGAGCKMGQNYMLVTRLETNKQPDQGSPFIRCDNGSASWPGNNTTAPGLYTITANER